MQKLDYNCYILETLEEVVAPPIKHFPPPINTYYRGQQQDWKLIPSVVRHNKKEPSFEIGIPFFSQLARFQHYGQATRLLDYSKNYYVALYFACCDDFNCDGIVHITHYDSISENSDYVKIICLATQLEKETSVYDFANQCQKFLPNSDIDTICAKIVAFLDYGFIVTPTDIFYTDNNTFNERIVAQEGCFYVFGNESNIAKIGDKISYTRMIIQPKIKKDCSIISHHDYSQKLYIKKELKKQILEYLNNLSLPINEYTLKLTE